MKIKYLAALVATSAVSLSMAGLSTALNAAQAKSFSEANSLALVNPVIAESQATIVARAGTEVAAAFEPPHSTVYVESTSNLAIRGADPVAYFTESAAVPGSPEYEYEWNGVIWRFSSAENMAAFQANPEAYAPEYGGYCAKAISEGNLASIDPRAWKIVNGKLYLNYSLEVQAQWEQNVSDNILRAEAFWPEVLTEKTLFENQLTWAQ